jgi:hypothetical protein
MRRTASETQLYEDEAEADYKDFMFYSRVVNGIISKQPSLYQDDSLKHENHQCLQNIVRARHDATNATVSNAANGNGQAAAAEQTLVSSAFQQERSQRMIRFTTQALAVSEGHEHYYDEDHDDNDDDDDSEEGIFDLEL